MDALALLPHGARVLVGTATGESPVFAEALMSSGDAVAATFTGIFVSGLSRTTYLPNAACRVETFFLTPELARQSDRVTFLPLCYQDILARLRSVQVDAALMMVSPPDDQGRCSFGPATDFLAELWPAIPLRIAQINPMMPRTLGDRGIPWDALDAVVEEPAPLVTLTPAATDPTSEAIASHVAQWVPDGATLQTGLGKVPGAVLRALGGHRDLRVHSGLIGDEVAYLLEQAALADGCAVTAGVAIGSERLYHIIGQDTFVFRPVSVTHDAAAIMAIPKFISINSALAVDLFAQAYSEAGSLGLSSGPGGASDYARATRYSEGGLRIIALPATGVHGAVSRIIAPGTARGPVSLGRFDIDIVATEHGAVDLRGLSHQRRASALIDIAAPAHRDGLAAAWTDQWRKLAGEAR